jgi:hypothetical protein
LGASGLAERKKRFAMSDFYKRITEMQGSVEGIVRKVPGFKGYFEKQDRRAADKLLRDKLVRDFEAQLAEFSRLQVRLTDGGGIKYMSRIQSIDTRLRTLIDKIQSAPQGYSGVFDAVKISEDTLKSVYAFDNGLLVYQDQLAIGLKSFADVIGTDQVSGVIEQLDAVVTELNNTFAKRVDAMLGLTQAV